MSADKPQQLELPFPEREAEVAAQLDAQFETYLAQFSARAVRV